jgi:gluconolactonase
MKCFIQLFLTIVCAAHLLAADSKIIAPGATLQKLAGDFLFTEGPACDGSGNVFFTDQPNDRILKWSVDGKLSTFMQPCGRANGLSFDPEGYLWACADETNELWRINPAGKATVIVKDYQGKLLNGPNDVWIRPGGGLYFTDPYYKRSYWKRGPKEMGECVYFLAPDYKTLTRHHRHAGWQVALRGRHRRRKDLPLPHPAGWLAYGKDAVLRNGLGRDDD